ncbi:esterase family protein [Clostridium tyrobutyricum]|jgi:enterochelin esterase-like enzyme|uniref:alpha/beta hydrolase n=1 Tax=Clostridium tyrobutyricum TaxID=1519 RepID=UPI00073DA2CD|nr:alpha/beta hydrolase-fold protein [Clostridium tyrobutyricum]MBR9649415.1 esterase family protein [Clostridium tyrobutyricum]MBV4429571.1 esterase family protein [Clostridium tyrobutyricum]MBV4444805.1 esterase family protein [Clostridium tyrobutyricum]MBV4449421.1 esterase family protein [Clostridium tyrobutyricum]MCH4199810.1 esterase family protein [Clostridium tyrobutyricum]
MNKSKVEKVDFHSNVLGKEMSMLVYLPGCYNSSTPLPVLYFLHGRSGNENLMSQIDINGKADKLIKDGKIKPMIIVCPRIENSRGLNSSLICKKVPDHGDNSTIINLGMYEDYFMKEVIPLTDKTFNTIKDRKGRYIGGISAGGYIALHNTFRHQNMFSKVGGHMPALELKLEDEDKPYYKNMELWEKYDPINIARNNNIYSDIDVYLDAGDKDEGRFYEGCSILHKILKQKGINSQNHIFTGNHSAEYIQSNIAKYIKFYGC